MGMERGCSCDAAAKQFCKKEENSQLSAPRPRVQSTSGRGVSGRCWVMSECSAGCAWRNSSGKHLPGAAQTLGAAWEPPEALPASVVGLHGAGKPQQPQPMPRGAVC